MTMLVVGLLPATAFAQTTFRVTTPVEAVARVTVRCERCAWDIEGREAVMLRVRLDDRYVQHLPVSRSGVADYSILIGAVAPGEHTLTVGEDAELTPRDLRGGAVVERVAVHQTDATRPEHRPLSLAPFVYARPDTVGRFTDVPLFMWYEIEPTARGTRYRYSVIFSNEDGGTPADRLMATWGRTTDIEYLYSVEVDAAGAILEEDMQGPKHEVLPYRGRREVRHPLLWVSTENNMVLDSGTTSVRYAPEPVAVSLENVSREVVMDANPWLYEVMSKELKREGKIVAAAPPGNGTIPDPRRYAYIEGCGTAGDAAVALAIRVAGEWIASDRGIEAYRITRDGCFRAAVPLPAATDARGIDAVRVQAFAREGKPPMAEARLTRINTVFMLNDRFIPGKPLLHWTGSATLRAGGPPFEIVIK
jgi:hypothetical protein